MLKVKELELPPPGPGLKTVMAAVPVAAMSPAAIWAVTSVLLTNAVGRSLPFQRTTELDTKFEPSTVRVKAGPPAPVLLGESAVIIGMGFVPLVMVKFTAFEVLPPGAGLVTVTAGVPAEAMAAAGMAAVNCVALTNVVLRAVPPKVTIEAATKFVPLIVSVKAALPAAALFGEIVLIVGAGLDPLGGGG